MRHDMRQRRVLSRSEPRYSMAFLLLGPALVIVLAMGVSASGATIPRELAGVSVTHVVRAKPKPATRPAEVLSGTGVIRLGPHFEQASGYERFTYVLVSRSDARKAARLPGTTLAYMSGTSVQREWSTGVTYREALANDWLLKDASGAYVMNVEFGAFVADIGNPAYQRRFIANTLAFVKRTKIDGLFIDDVTGDPEAMSDVYPAKYPDPAAWEAAMVSFVQTVGKALKSRGYYVLANAAKWISDDSRSDTAFHTTEFWKRIAPGVSGLMTEYWLQSPLDHGELRVLGTDWDQYWNQWQRLVSVAQTSGVDFFGLTYGSSKDTRAMRYARASFLLDWDGRGGALLYSITDRPDPYHPSWSRQLGKPVARKLERTSGVWQRRYERGMVVVNATNEPADVRVFEKVYTVGSGDAVFVSAPRS